MSSLYFSFGTFTAVLDLPEGKYEYKFIVDGQWLHNRDEVHNYGVTM